VHEAGEVVAGQDAAVADEQLGAGFLGVQAGGVSAQRGGSSTLPVPLENTIR